MVKKSFGNITDSMNVNSESNHFITIRDHKENFLNHPKVRLYNSARKQLVKKSKTMLDNIDMKFFQATKINQWKNTVSAAK